MTKKDHEGFKSSTECWSSKRAYRKGGMKVKDHDHITEKYQGPAH